jgi:predicted Zn finger-like uncharacterized protein
VAAHSATYNAVIMTLAVQCPQCLTAFKVVQDQLKLAHGWVRCGRCEQIFDARSHWLALGNSDVALAVDPSAPNPPTAAPPAQPALDPALNGLAQANDAAPDKDDFTELDLTQDVLHLAPTRPRRVWHVLNLMLGLALLSQWVWWAKSPLLAPWPAAHEWVQSQCAQWHCQMDWPQGLGSVMIERAHFEPDGEGHHRLEIQLSNRASHPVATPWVDLSLTDGDDRVVIRRALAPEEMGLPRYLTPGADAVSSVHWRVDSDVEDRLSGYRAEIFYP